MRTRRTTFRILLFVIGGIALVSALRATADATPGHLLIIPTEDGYGVETCLTSDAACGRVVADAWCQANGHANAEAYGRAGDRIKDLASSRDEAQLKSLRPDSLVVSCTD